MHFPITGPPHGPAAVPSWRLVAVWARRSVLILLPAGGSACSAAPAQDVFGSFVPSWLSCAVAGVAAAVLCRFLLKFAGLSDQLLAPPLTYVGIAVAVTLAAWLLWFGH